MSDQWSFSDEELENYFEDPDTRKGASQSPPDSDESISEQAGEAGDSPSAAARSDSGPWTGWMGRWIDHPQMAQAASVLSIFVAIGLAGVLLILGMFFYLSSDIPSTQSLENPSLDRATIAYTADGEELARYARQNRTPLPYDSISVHAIEALIATEDHRFHRHWGVDLQGIVAATVSTLTGNLRGASTISQQLARNLYDEEVGREVSVTRKLREIITAVELERRYTKTEIVEMYFNTVSFGSNAFGIDAAARTFYGVRGSELDVPQAATLVGLLKGTTYYNPVRNPENAQRRRNVVLGQMVRNGFLTEEELAEYREEPVNAEYHSAELYASLAPYFAEHVRNELQRLTRDPSHPLSDHDMYGDGLRVYTTLDSKVQEHAQAAVDAQMEGLQAVVDYEWGQSQISSLGIDFEPYLERVSEEGFEPFAHFWNTNTNLVNEYIRDTNHYQSLTNDGYSDTEALEELHANETFVDSLRTLKTRLEAGMVSMEPRTGQIKAWVGGRDFRSDQYDKVSIARRQSGSTFKPFVYTAAIDNGYSPFQTYVDSTFQYYDEGADEIWSPTNFSGHSGEDVTLTQALARSLNTVTARLAIDIEPSTIVQYARRMGVHSTIRPQDVGPAISLGTTDVTLLEMVNAYSTLANGGLRYEPQTITRVEDRYGNVLWEQTPAPQEALSERTAYTVVDMMRGVIDFGTGIRMRTQFGLSGYDLSGKTGTTQRSADGWFVLMHPDLVTGAWVGFNDQRITFRTSTWGQGGRNALFLVGDFSQRIAEMENSPLSREAEFPLEEYDDPPSDDDRDTDGVGW